MKIHTVLIVTIVLIVDRASCGVIEGVYDKVSDTTHAIKDDVYSWWTYGVDTIMGTDTRVDGPVTNQTLTEENVENEQPGILGRLYNKVKGGVTSGYMKIHDMVLGKNSDPNKGIIKTLYERSMKKLSEVQSYIFGEDHTEDKPETQAADEAVNQQVIKLLFENKTIIFNTESEKQALDSLRQKLTQTGDEVMHLADNEKELVRKAYNTIRSKSDEFIANATESADNVKDKLNENIEKTQEFIQVASQKAKEGAQNVGQEVKKAAEDIEKKVERSV